MRMARFEGHGRWSLGVQVLVLALAVLAALAVPAYFAFTFIINSTVLTLGSLFAEKQILYDRYRGMGALIQEVSLAETLARSPVIRDWALDEDDPEKRVRGLAELEHYRQAFTDRSYFFVVAASGNYYFNDPSSGRSEGELRYTIDPANPGDAWYFATVALGEGCHLNVNHDDVLALTKVWINCVIRHEDAVVGVLGSGLDLSAFIREVVDVPQAGVQSIFVDESGAVQAHRDARLINFQSLTTSIENRTTIFGMLDHERDRGRLREMMEDITGPEPLVRSQFFEIDGQDVLVGVGYLDRLGWYNVTLMDVDTIIDRRLFLPIGLLLAAMMAGAVAMVVFAVQRRVVDRLARIEAGAAAVEAGDFDAIEKDHGRDEIGRLSRTLARMAASVRDTTDTLEARVRQRTAELETLANKDPMTGILNRRGFADAFRRGQARAARSGTANGLLLFDLDRFKDVNDTHGHQAGDQVILETVARLTGSLRAEDICARWGGDEFLLLICECTAEGLGEIALRLHSGFRADPIALADGESIAMTVSVGGYLAAPEDGLDMAADMADAALYSAKDAGRDRVRIFQPAATFGSQAPSRSSSRSSA